MPNKKSNQPARIHPDDRARIAALNMASAALRGTPEEKPNTSYYIPALIHCTLPHSDPKTPHWIKKSGGYSLIIQSGINDEGRHYGVPYGSFPRLTLAYIITRVVETKERRVELSNHFGGFLKEIGYTGNLRGSTTRAAKSVREQLIRLLASSIAFEQNTGDDEQGGKLRVKADVARRFSLWWDFKNPSQGTLFESHIDLSEDFHNAILASPVPLRTDVLAALKRSPLALDVYMWVSYRLFTMQVHNEEQVTLSYGRLQDQFGTGIAEANYRQFRREFKLALEKVSAQWEQADSKKHLNYELHEDGMTLFRSPLLLNISKSQQAKNQAAEKAAQILAVKRFDDLTLREARQVAGDKWDVKYLQEQYFAWLERQKISPKDPKKHFFAFIKRHRQRNER